MTAQLDMNQTEATKKNNKKLFIKTYGCQMNVYDSQRMAEVLSPVGYELSETIDDADMVIMNTCHIREKASEKVYSEIGRIRKHQEKKAADGGRMLLAVAGCVAQAEGEEIMSRAPEVDMVFGPQTYHRLPEMVAKASRAAGQKILDTDFPPEDKFDHLPDETKSEGVTAFLTIQEGCDKFCTFCVVPYTRGAESSRNVTSIVAEAKRLVASGAREITLLGQNVNAFHGQGRDGSEWGLGRLVRHLADKVDGLDRIRYTTSHPRDMDDDLIAAHGELPHLMPYLHLPVQSGADNMLAAMNRKHTAKEYMELVEKLFKARPDLALSSDFIVGFPGETKQDHADTIRLVSEVGFGAGAFSFKYSERPGTPAAASEMQVAEEVKDERLAGLQQLLNAQQQAFNESMAGKTIPVLFEKPGRENGQMMGRSPYLQPVHIQGPESLVGQIIDCKIDHVKGHSLFGEAVEPFVENEQERAIA
ncbi:tRNA (N6-isopentenyl adenosine(37)-C2)-methylthiotransferase MiaB [Curvivirga aplysinae]|uniref:tRNA (N6-isopentenyl adenosine(37)-C2)-methylthiotransferase MiaB n=1 Tax=Curvivirga aplysinae TaxID=2529852 RepID=UPI0012BB8A4D|nr:tRNA (N6-isopentenyl adenosine(37)-C2)-methylthiotransferase MiaB [Curvivirga aplysinae]MTI08746.1 tRNA (N6-isopentenyl adenosine(37)-C2)-methylthiotransferase MiaB [Curvivirga aplysinae]